MREIESGRMQTEAGHGGAKRFRCVQVIAKNRMSHRFEMQPELVAPSSQRCEFDPCDRHSMIGIRGGEHIVQIADLSATRHHPFRQARLPVFVVNHLPWCVVEILPDREIDLARILVWMSSNQGVIRLLGLPVLKLTAQFPM